MRVLQTINQILLLIVLTLLIASICYIWIIVLPMQAEINSILSNTNKAVIEWSTYSHQLNTLLSSTKTQNSIGLLLRTGDDLNRSVKRFNVILDNLNGSIQETNANFNNNLFPGVIQSINKVNKEVIPSIVDTVNTSTKLLQTTTETIQQAEIQFTETIEDTQVVIKSIDKSIKDINVIINDENIPKTLEQIELSVEKTNKILDATYNKFLRSKRWIIQLLLDIGTTAYRMFIKP